MPRENLTDKRLQALKAAPKGERYDISDGITPGLAVRVTDRGTKTFVLVARFPGSSNPTRRAIGEYGAVTLESARETARKWLQLITRGIDPKAEEQKEREAAARKRENTFERVTLDYLADIPTRKRNRHAVQDEKEIRRELLDPKRNKFLKKPIPEVTDADIAELIGAIRDRPAPGMAYNVWGHVKAIFSWAMWPERRQGYGLTVNPTQHLQPKHFKLAKTVSTRVLTDDEIRAYWAAADATPYPLGPFYKMLMLTGQRKAEVAEAEWPEFAGANRALWTVPEERFKSGQSHIVPIADDVQAIMDSLPRYKGEKTGKFLFSTTLGLKPINGFSRAKEALDTAMLAELRKADPDAELPEWVFHDIRRTVRTRLSGLRVNSDVAEMVIGHGKTGLRRVYDQYEFEPEMREALQRWALALKQIVAPTGPENVLTFEKKAG
ncbi:site-specific integrase [Rhizobium ruizarguesonis]|uniref:tyrosine-type recombinase/integrase n=1 Tax=Rhizobium ruizarguesonis TaxID=2081791 RepID=UPI001031DDE2|nr:site-specific integrase [Rhizobium ruizarguesonis]NEH80583.1 integrase arm-type DNA-binding domain-containing protein [Rhizobium ruizarguesonis]NEI75507.1 integrase arm-type DNA-binding domain-containing protein [Rhizobium ruizarguesonis]TAX77544.1 site-specific integrase [Rhizobium ruizarguesonis]